MVGMSLNYVGKLGGVVAIEKLQKHHVQKGAWAHCRQSYSIEKGNAKPRKGEPLNDRPRVMTHNIDKDYPSFVLCRHV